MIYGIFAFEYPNGLGLIILLYRDYYICAELVCFTFFFYLFGSLFSTSTISCNSIPLYNSPFAPPLYLLTHSEYLSIQLDTILSKTSIFRITRTVVHYTTKQTSMSTATTYSSLNELTDGCNRFPFTIVCPV